MSMPRSLARISLPIALFCGLIGCSDATSTPAATDDGGSDVATGADAIDAEGSTAPDWAGFVRPLIGTAPSPTGFSLPGATAGNTHPGATSPFGMVQWGPDTDSAPLPAYDYRNKNIRGFSLTHLSGVGCASFDDFPFMPTIAAIDASPERSPATYYNAFDHAHETAAPGHYGVALNSGIQVDLTVTARAGIGKLVYPSGQPTGRLLISAGHLVYGVKGEVASKMPTKSATLSMRSDGVVLGSRTSGGFCGQSGDYTVHFAARFLRAPIASGSWSGDTFTRTSTSTSGEKSGLFFEFDTSSDSTVLVKVGLSYVSPEAALANLDAELTDWGYAAAEQRARAGWNAMLGRIEISAGDPTQKAIFYTSLYRALLHPNVFSDVDGSYMGFDKKPHRATGRTQYANFSAWDTYRSWAQLVALIAPDRASDMVSSLLADANECGALPLWPMANADTGVMLGDPSSALIASAYSFGARTFDTSGALAAMVKNATDPTASCGGVPGRRADSIYNDLGFTPADAPVWGPASTTLEYATADFALGQFASALGKKELAAQMIARARNWTKVFDSKAGYVRARFPDGTWLGTFDAASSDGFAEGSASQYTFGALHDLPALGVALGGKASAIARLDALFAKVNSGPSDATYAIGNEPGFATPYAYNFFGAPYKTQAIIAKLTSTSFGADPGGMPGNDDLGAMGAWYVWSTLGLYPAIPGVPGLAVGSPSFAEAVIHLPSGATIKLSAPGAGGANVYIQSLMWNGAAVDSSWIDLTKLTPGGKLAFVMGSAPNKDWGASDAVAPPSAYTVACDPSHCPTGCCDTTGLCVEGVAPIACGTGGTACTTCKASEECGLHKCVARTDWAIIGSPCTADAQCAGLGAGGLCKLTTSPGGFVYPGGYCTKLCGTASTSSCPLDSVCVGGTPGSSEEQSICWSKCDKATLCRAPGYACYTVGAASLALPYGGCWLSPAP